MVRVDRPVKAELVYRLRDALEDALKTQIPTDDPARVSTVVAGKYTQDRTGIVLSVHADHPLGEERGRYDHTVEGTPRDRTERPWFLPPESIGGSQWRQIYGAVEIRWVLEGTSTSVAIGIVETVTRRVRTVIKDTTTLCPLQDDYGDMLFGLAYYADYGYPSGGDNVSVDAHWVDFTARIASRRTR